MSGFSLSSATSSATERAGTDGLTTSTLYDFETLIKGAKSAATRNGMFGNSDGAAINGMPMAKIEEPSAGCLSTSLPASIMPGLGRFSTMTGQPSALISSFAMTRPMTSGGVEGAAG